MTVYSDACEIYFTPGYKSLDLCSSVGDLRGSAVMEIILGGGGVGRGFLMNVFYCCCQTDGPITRHGGGGEKNSCTVRDNVSAISLFQTIGFGGRAKKVSERGKKTRGGGRRLRRPQEFVDQNHDYRIATELKF